MRLSGHRPLQIRPARAARARTRVSVRPCRVSSRLICILLLAVDGGGIPFATQFFHDDYDDGGGFDDVYDGGAPVEAGEQDLLAATQGQTRRVKPEAVNYAKRAKRVDVRKLKENIWKGLDIVAPAVEDGEDAMVSCVTASPCCTHSCRLTFRTRTNDSPPIRKKRGHSHPSFPVCTSLIRKTRWTKSAQVSASSVCCILPTSVVSSSRWMERPRTMTTPWTPKWKTAKWVICGI